ncbi:hypothetical protein SAMN04487906_2660 [Zhouia amylolytica]|uniref:Uncharacterized protein n=2 Tax=Zhouia amylolytica TaxID=376730 RepID=W2UNI5_9FLAO|nr:hypothetical protein [Zhouia amylolytica]ETN95563.1 hypothetical protein P278_12850 [Zhouia amylolytica AD3]MCQ0110757.1 hypothetical protein [Zhouia amylolytica]SFT03929.1 hypothetical protein SAMN04487906_2660 [Zhouia amylolytica]
MNRSINSKSNTTKVKLISVGTLVAVLIAISPYVFYLYESLPLDNTWNTPFFDFKTDYFATIYMMAWVFMNKFVPFYLLILWFLTCRHWWYHIILIPISMFMFQMVVTINDEARYVDEFEIYYIIPVMMVVIPIVYLIRAKIFDKIVHGIDLKEIEKELKEYEEKGID